MLPIDPSSGDFKDDQRKQLAEILRSPAFVDAVQLALNMMSPDIHNMLASDIPHQATRAGLIAGARQMVKNLKSLSRPLVEATEEETDPLAATWGDTHFETPTPTE